MYREVTLENTLKLIIRCKLAFNSRTMLVQCFDLHRKYSEKVTNLKIIIDKQQSYKIEQEKFDEIKSLVEVILDRATLIFE